MPTLPASLAALAADRHAVVGPAVMPRTRVATAGEPYDADAGGLAAALAVRALLSELEHQPGVSITLTRCTWPTCLRTACRDPRWRARLAVAPCAWDAFAIRIKLLAGLPLTPAAVPASGRCEVLAAGAPFSVAVVCDDGALDPTITLTRISTT